MNLKEPMGRNFGSAIIFLREMSSMKQGELAQKAGLQQASLSRIEKGHTLPTTATLHKIAEAFNIPIELLWKLSDRYKKISLDVESMYKHKSEALIITLFDGYLHLESMRKELRQNDLLEQVFNHIEEPEIKKLALEALK